MNQTTDKVVDVFIDLRSPYSYLALRPARHLAERSGFRFDWWPYITDFQAAYGGEIGERSSRDIVKLKYLYMDCRRMAKLQGLTIRATEKLWDPTLTSKAMLFAKSKNRLWEFCDPMLAKFWRREFNLESCDQIDEALTDAGVSVSEWHNYLEVNATHELEATLARAQGLGVFGAPTFIYQGEIYWGGDRLNLLSDVLFQQIPSRRIDHGTL